MACPTLDELVGCRSYSDLVPVVGRVLAESVVPTVEEDDVTVFHGHLTKDTPEVDKFLYRLCRYGHASKEVFPMVMIYLNRYREATKVALCEENAHRLMVAAFVTAVKIHDDVHYCNKFFSRLGGISLREMNRLERAFLISLDFSLEISPAEYQAMVQSLTVKQKIPSSPPVSARGSAFRRKLSSSSAGSSRSSRSSEDGIPRGAAIQAVRAMLK